MFTISWSRCSRSTGTSVHDQLEHADKEHPNLDLPYKRPKGGELTSEEKEYNRALSSFRVGVEHRIGRTKRFRIVGERFRNPLATHHTKTSVVAGLVNIEAGFWPF